ncbi:TetR/AcrR family transcriptional regulator [Litorivicinus sp.]|nr:TetR/AcrR family transcriptional regulator [Litorivicinus sp.]MDC1207801.1 TetR/AcrR family transcriptional regulator [Litorivicinus sp.]MDC1239719.1 TetR/AcrR family transcriptional regulator [Litorivicinus sp.]
MNSVRKIGRPTTLDKNHVLAVALKAYWDHGPLGVSIDKICAMAGVSKPSVYREFGSGDSLIAVALQDYFEKYLIPLIESLRVGRSLLHNLTHYASAEFAQKACNAGINGCLFVKMYNQMHLLGPISLQKVLEVNVAMLIRYESIVSEAQQKGRIVDHLPPKILAAYIHNQLILVASQRGRGEDSAKVEQLSKIAFSVLSND